MKRKDILEWIIALSFMFVLIWLIMGVGFPLVCHAPNSTNTDTSPIAMCGIEYFGFWIIALVLLHLLLKHWGWDK